LSEASSTEKSYERAGNADMTAFYLNLLTNDELVPVVPFPEVEA
jgi:hypothetical protein